MADNDSDILSQLRIAKNAYLFNLRRRYMPIAHYQIKKSKADTPLAKFVEGLRPHPAPLSRASYGKAGKGAKSAPSAPLASTILKTALAAVLLLLLLAAWFLISFHPPAPSVAPPGPPMAFNGSLDLRVLNTTLLTYGPENPPMVQPEVMFDFTGINLAHVDTDARVYPSQPSRQVFVLRYARNGADNYAAFRSSLESHLNQQGWSVLDIGPEDLGRLPGASTLIVPTGYLPALLLGDAQNRTPSIVDLASRGVVVIYIGLPFDQNVLGPDGVFFPPDPALVSRTGIVFDTGSPPQATADLPLSLPLYRAAWRSGGAQPLWGSVSELPAGSGFILFVPENLDGGWPGNGAGAGEEIASLVSQEPYRPALSDTNWSSDGPFDAPQRVTLFGPAFAPANGTILRLRFTLNDTNGASEQLVTDWPISKNAAGDLYFDNPALLPSYLGGQPVPVRAQLREKSNRPVKIFFQMLANGSVLETRELEVGLTQPTGLKPATIGTDQLPGDYILRLADQTGYVYAATHVQVVGLSIVTPRANTLAYNAQFATGAFNFTFLINGQPSNVPYVKVQMDAPGAPAQEFRDTSQAAYTWARDYPRGNYTVNFDFGTGYTQSVVLPHVVARNFWERPELIVLGLVAAAVFGAAFFLRQPEKQLLSLDIPDFPPKSVIRIPMSAATVLSLFEQINKDYAWEHMPLKPEELKNGFRKTLYNGKPVVIGDNNLQRLLEQLAERKLVQESLGYWAPSSWSKASGQSIERMALFRSLRDLFVNNAVRFSRLGALPNCDVKILIGANEYYLHFYLGDEGVIQRALQTISLGRTWIIFRDEVERDRFEEHLHSSAPAPLALKMQIYDKRCWLFTLDYIPGLLRRLKVE
ncbi:MAG: hypothetical protein KGH63_02250 [Candidatus Micrarchaeota archaeon]|nr:hypothetical protein [Candidatus Micrarchaeota archaeon]